MSLVEKHGVVRGRWKKKRDITPLTWIASVNWRRSNSVRKKMWFWCTWHQNKFWGERPRCMPSRALQACPHAFCRFVAQDTAQRTGTSHSVVVSSLTATVGPCPGLARFSGLKRFRSWKGRCQTTALPVQVRQVVPSRPCSSGPLLCLARAAPLELLLSSLPSISSTMLSCKGDRSLSWEDSSSSCCLLLGAVDARHLPVCWIGVRSGNAPASPLFICFTLRSGQ